MLIDITEPVTQMLGYGLTASGSAALTGESDLQSAALITALAEAALSGDSDLVSAVTLRLAASASMSAQSNLTVDETIVYAAASIVIASSNLEAESTRLQFASAQVMSSASNMTATLLVAVTVNPRPMVASSSLTATVYVPSNYLVLPTIEVAYTDNILLKRYPIDNGQTLLITDNVGTLVTFAAQQDIANADYYFRGGSTNILDDDALAAVQAAGYGEYVVTQ